MHGNEDHFLLSAGQKIFWTPALGAQNQVQLGRENGSTLFASNTKWATLTFDGLGC